MVKMEIINESEEKISILLKETDRAFVNALRRSLMSDTPKMAIETVRFQMGTFDLCLSCGHRNGRSEEHTSELQSRRNLVCRLLLEKKKSPPPTPPTPT